MHVLSEIYLNCKDYVGISWKKTTAGREHINNDKGKESRGRDKDKKEVISPVNFNKILQILLYNTGLA